MKKSERKAMKKKLKALNKRDGKSRNESELDKAVRKSFEDETKLLERLGKWAKK